MSNFTKAESITLDEVKARILSSDLVPSRSSLSEGIDAVFEKLHSAGIQSLADLKKAIKNPARIGEFATGNGIPQEYLILLRRELESYDPKPFLLREIDWLPSEEIQKVESLGIATSFDLYQAVWENGGLADLAGKTGISTQKLEYLASLASLARVQWVSLNFARMLVEAGYENAAVLAGADADRLCGKLEEVNSGGKYFKGKIGLRDVKRLIHSAKYV